MDVTYPNATLLWSKVAWTLWAIWSYVQPHPRSSQMRYAIPMRAALWSGGKVKPAVLAAKVQGWKPRRVRVVDYSSRLPPALRGSADGAVHQMGGRRPSRVGVQGTVSLHRSR
jgi:hypothetical protein